MMCPSELRGSTRIEFAGKTATVTVDADKTHAAALAKATIGAGYPSKVRK
jgi:mercuric ion binding protein